jgi:hypothetical protein
MQPLSSLLEDIGIENSDDVKFIKKNLYYSEVTKKYYVIYLSKEPGFFTDEAKTLLRFFGTGISDKPNIIFLFFCNGVTADFQVYFGTIDESHEELSKMKPKDIISKYYKKISYKYSIADDDGPRKIPK